MTAEYVSPSGPATASAKAKERAAREAAALRENLRKRKQQARSRLQTSEQVHPDDAPGRQKQTE